MKKIHREDLKNGENYYKLQKSEIFQNGSNNKLKIDIMGA